MTPTRPFNLRPAAMTPHYPLWRALLIIILLLFAVVYALPNFFGEDPAIQISAASDLAFPNSMIEQMKTALDKANLPYLSLERQSPHSALIRFQDSELQLKAQDLMQATLGSKYVVALNLAPRTPAWLRALAANPMRLGLDLRGGIHFLLKIDTMAMLKERTSGDLRSMAMVLREASIRYASMRTMPDGTTRIGFRQSSDLNKALPLLTQRFPDYAAVVSDRGDRPPMLQLAMRKESLVQLRQYAVEQNLNTLRNRVNALGIAEPVIQQQGTDQISVDLPGIQDTARAKDIIGKVATIRWQLQDVEHDAKSAQATGAVPFGSTLYQYENQPVLLKNDVILRGSSITGAIASLDENAHPAVSINLSGSEIPYFNRVTAENVGKPLAAIYVETKPYKQIIDGQVQTRMRQVETVIQIAQINQALGSRFQITGLSSMQSARNLALLLRSGAYTAPVSFVQEQVVGPSLGKRNIERGVLSCEVGSLLVIVFMLFYYRLFGLIANIALVLNVVLILAVMSVLGATLTLPGIAGIVLTVGMAVDANVLINERIREELRRGMSPQAAIHLGYKRAFTTIVDANVTTLIVVLILYALGTGSVQGFAVTLMIGLLSSMATAIFFTRAIVDALCGGYRPGRNLPIGISVTTS